MDFEQQTKKLARVVRERESIELAKIDLQQEMKALASEAPGSRTAVYPAEMGELVRRLVALLEAEQEQSTMLYELLAQAYADLVTAHDDLAEAHGDPPLPG